MTKSLKEFFKISEIAFLVYSHQILRHCQDILFIVIIIIIVYCMIYLFFFSSEYYCFKRLIFSSSSCPLNQPMLRCLLFVFLFIYFIDEYTCYHSACCTLFFLPLFLVLADRDLSMTMQGSHNTHHRLVVQNDEQTQRRLHQKKIEA